MNSFQPFVDKENSSQVRAMARPLSMGSMTGPVGKTFHGNQQQLVGSAIRKALGDVNSRNIITPRKGLGKLDNIAASKQPLGMKKPVMQMKPPMPASKPPKIRHHEKQKVEAEKPSVKCEATARIEACKPLVEEKENMILVEEEDDFEDVWPKSERPFTYIEQMLNWRPSRIYPYTGSSGSEDDLFIPSDLDTDDSFRLSELNEMDDMLFTESGCMDAMVDPSELLTIELPSLDDLELEDIDLFTHLPS